VAPKRLLGIEGPVPPLAAGCRRARWTPVQPSLRPLGTEPSLPRGATCGAQCPMDTSAAQPAAPWDRAIAAPWGHVRGSVPDGHQCSPACGRSGRSHRCPVGPCAGLSARWTPVQPMLRPLGTEPSLPRRALCGAQLWLQLGSGFCCGRTARPGCETGQGLWTTAAAGTLAAVKHPRWVRNSHLLLLLYFFF